VIWEDALNNSSTFKAVYMDLTELNQTTADTSANPITDPIIVSGRIVSLNMGRSFPLVIELEPISPPLGSQGEIILCLFRIAHEPEPELGSLVSVAGLLDKTSIENHLILTSSALISAD
jgi:hypothetical protein